MTEPVTKPEPVAPSLASLEDQIEELRGLVVANNRLLKRMRRDALVGGILKTGIWIVLIVASTYYSFKFLEPYLGMIQGGDGSSGGTDFQALIDQYKAQMGQ